MAPKKNQSNASTTDEVVDSPSTEATSKRSHSDGVLLGRLASKLVELGAKEIETLARSPEVIKAGFAAQRETLLKGLTPEQREGVLAFAKVLGPKQPEAAAE